MTVLAYKIFRCLFCCKLPFSQHALKVQSPKITSPEAWCFENTWQTDVASSKVRQFGGFLFLCTLVACSYIIVSKIYSFKLKNYFQKLKLVEGDEFVLCTSLDWRLQTEDKIQTAQCTL